jgi:hypothetical protein
VTRHDLQGIAPIVSRHLERKQLVEDTGQKFFAGRMETKEDIEPHQAIHIVRFFDISIDQTWVV